MTIVSAAEQKLESARYHLGQLERSPDLAIQRHHLGAFLGAARSVVIKLRDADKQKHGPWISAWEKALTADDYAVWKFVTTQRNDDVHGTGPTVSDSIEERSGMQRLQSGSNTPMVAQLLAMGLYESQGTIGIPVLVFEVAHVQKPAREVCAHYLRLLETFVDAFKAKFP